MPSFISLATFSCLILMCSAAQVLHHSRKTIPKGFLSRGAAPADDSITIRLALASNDVATLQQKLLTISDPASPDYRKWLTKEEVQSFIKPSQKTVDTIAAWATANKLTTHVISPNQEWIAVTLPISKANKLFSAQFTTFEHSSSKKQLVRTLAFSLPEELVPHVKTAHPMTSFTNPNVRFASKMVKRRQPAPPVVKKRQVDPSCNDTVTPACLETLYEIPTSPATQQNNSLLVTGYVDEFANQADLQAFLKRFQPKADASTNFTLLTLDNGTNPQSPIDAGSEANLDVQYTAGLALGVPLTFLSVGGEDFETALLDTTSFLAGVDNPPSVMTTSYGEDEDIISPSLASQICDGYMALGARGISVIFSSGDGGVRGGHDSEDQCTDNTFIPVFPAACPYVTSVGATTAISPEFATNFSSGGFSNYFAQPSYQSTAVSQFLSTLPSDFAGVFNKTGRGFPDVSAQGLNIPVIVDQESGLTGGTSASSPIIASIIALINDRLAAQNQAPLGFLNPFLYSSNATGAFTDITSGSNPGFTCSNDAVSFTATKGWDPVTGVGTPLFSQLLAAVGVSSSSNYTA